MNDRYIEGWNDAWRDANRIIDDLEYRIYKYEQELIELRSSEKVDYGPWWQ